MYYLFILPKIFDQMSRKQIFSTATTLNFQTSQADASFDYSVVLQSSYFWNNNTVLNNVTVKQPIYFNH